MKRIWILFSCFPHFLCAQYYFDFEDGTAEGEGHDPFWKMEQVPAGRWQVTDENTISGFQSLQHSYDNPVAGIDYLVIQHEHAAAGGSLSLSFRIRHGYPPSGSNNWQAALLASAQKDGQEQVEITEGIILGVNYRASDDLVRIWRKKGDLVEELCSSGVNFQEMAGTGLSPFFRLECIEDGDLKLFFSSDPLVSPAKEVASCTIEKLCRGNSLIFRYEYSAAQDRKLWIDDIELAGLFVRDTIPPRITGWDLQDMHHVLLRFTERIGFAEKSGFYLSPDENSEILLPDAPLKRDGWIPDSVAITDTIIRLYFADVLPNREPLVLLVSGIRDLVGNCPGDTLVRILRNDAVWGDIVFNEIMFDPEPSVDLSIGEYLELYNRSEYSLHLEGWKVQAGDRIYPLTGSDFTGNGHSILTAHGYAVLPHISLSNQGSKLLLYSGSGELIHSTSYKVPFQGPEWKKEGGWSLESPDPEMVCHIFELWQYSTDPSGGTPGRLNSVDAELQDREAPVFLYFGFEKDHSICLHYSEPVRMYGELTWIAGTKGKQPVIEPGGIKADSVVRILPLFDQLACYFPVDPAALEDFRIIVPAVADCKGNLSGDMVLYAGSVPVPSAGSTLINEIMFDPAEGAPEYIELYHPGPGFTDLKDLSLDVVGEAEAPGGFAVLSVHSRIVQPGGFVVLTRNREHLMDAYDLEISGNWVEMESLESLPNSGGSIYLADRSGNTVDVADYSETMHLEMISDTKGISLERISPERPGNDPGNWHSAASIEGYATPGRRNSQYSSGIEIDDQLVLDPEVFSPDNDGHLDLLKIMTATGDPGCVIRLWITDLAGKTVRELANNHIAGPETCYIWDGTKDNGQMAEEGLYVVHLRGYKPSSGTRWNRKAATAVIYP